MVVTISTALGGYTWEYYASALQEFLTEDPFSCLSMGIGTCFNFFPCGGDRPMQMVESSKFPSAAGIHD
uniref:Uncharacterized protein n=1 Tax=Arundo donax TaxID=35708 RepID=A0A0A8XMV6_ARUDO